MHAYPPAKGARQIGGDSEEGGGRAGGVRSENQIAPNHHHHHRRLIWGTRYGNELDVSYRLERKTLE